MSAFLGALRTERPLLLDGGLGSLLIAAGLARGEPPERWVLERPAAVAAAHRAYAGAGSDAVHTCTFGAHPIRLAAFGLEARGGEIVRAAVALAREAGARFVVGDVGPTGEYLEPLGAGDLEAWREGYRRLAGALAAAGVDALHVETVGDRREALCALAALREEAPGLPAMVSLSFDRKPRGAFTLMGDPFAGSLRELLAAGAAAVGANCTLTSAGHVQLAREAREAGLEPMVLQPNAGRPIPDGARLRYSQAPETFAAEMAEAAAWGAAAVGGCCGTDTEFIGALAARLGRPGPASRPA
jgi:methionine synthase I (cobalamin-dependent)